MASLKVKTTGGVFALFSVYAPHNLKDTSEKLSFYDDLGKLLKRTSTNGPRFIYGDFNARIGTQRHGEQSVIGEHGFGREAVHKVDCPNRDLLIEFCECHGYAVAQTFVQQSCEDKVTYHEPHTAPMDTITHTGFAMLDLVLVPQGWRDCIQCLHSNRYAALASHHFLVLSTLDIVLAPRRADSKNTRLDWSVLQDPVTRYAFARRVETELCQASDGTVASNGWEEACISTMAVARELLPTKPKAPNKPWITTSTLELISKKQQARADHNWELEKELRKQISKAAKKDRAAWLEDLAAKGDWNAVRQLRKGRRFQQGRLYDARGVPVSSDERAETFAEHLEAVQWRVRPVTLIPDSLPQLGQTLQPNEEPFTEAELLKAIKHMSAGKATKEGDIPVEAFKALAAEGGHALAWLLEFCNLCWSTKSIPKDWATSSVTLIYKKGDPGMCDHYRPICLQSIGGKLFASMLKQRLLEAGIEDVLWPSQFGFRRGRSTEDAIFLARRRIELARAQRNGHICLLALDWAKAFDSINVASLLDGLRRAGLPPSFRLMIEAMLQDREYIVNECGCTSAPRAQSSGISQGCTLSPLLFIIAMSVLLRDAVGMLGTKASDQYSRGDLADIIYADDTLLIGIAMTQLQEYLAAVCAAGRMNGMELHFGKFQMISTAAGPVSLQTPEGSRVASKRSMEYLGVALHSDGSAEHELVRRIALAKADFKALSAIWSRSALTWRRKIRIFSALVESKLLYSLAGVVLAKRLEKKLDGFQCSCLRNILGIAPPYYSRISNAKVWSRASHPMATQLLRKRRLQLFGKVLRCPSGDLLRDSCFVPHTWIPAVDQFVRRVGRPSKEWVKDVLQDTTCLFGSMEMASRLASEKDSWSEALFDKLGF